VVAVVHLLGRGDDGVATVAVQRNDDGWRVQADGLDEPLGEFRTKREAVRSARSEAAAAAPSRLVVHRADGSVQRTYRYPSPVA